MSYKAKYVLCVVLFHFIGKAQITFPAVGATWHYAILWQNQTLKYTHDSLFAGKTTHVIETPYSFIDCAAIQQPIKTLTYTSNDSVFFHNSRTLNQWELLYNFNAVVGQKWRVLLKDTVWPNIPVTDTMTFSVDSVKFNTINSFLLKTLYVTSKETTSQGFTGFSDPHIIYDRIGANTYLTPFYSATGLTQTDCMFPFLLCYNDNSFGLYQPDTTSCTYIPNGIEKLKESDLEVIIYPNPSNGSFIIETNSVKKQNVRIFDLNGINVYNRESTGSSVIDVSNLSEGFYNINIVSGKRIINRRIVIVK